jgi:hypothetical protein
MMGRSSGEGRGGRRRTMGGSGGLREEFLIGTSLCPESVDRQEEMA